MLINLNKIILIIFFLNFITNSFAGDLKLGKETAQTICASCHGLDGVSSSAGNSALIPNITAQDKGYLVSRLKDYKSGKIEHPQMSLIAQMLSEEDIENVSEWYSSIIIKIELPQ